MMATSIISKLRLKFAEKSWNETFQLVRRCMDKPRDESKLSKPLARSLQTLQEVFAVPSLKTTKSRLEMITRQQGMGFHITEATCYLTADLFYLEVVLLPCGGVEDVKVASHGRSPVHSESFLQLLRSNQFTEFSMKLADLFTQYDIPGDNEIKLKLFKSLQYLGEDLQQISNLPRVQKDSDPHVDMINNGRIGFLIAGKEDSPLTIQFYINPTEGLNTSDFQVTDAVIQAAQVTLGVSDVTHNLQVASLLPQPAQLDPQGSRPVFLPLSEALCETLPACFLLKLQPAIPMMSSFVSKISQITDVTIPDVDLQWAPFPKLLMTRLQSANGHEETTDEQDAVFTASLPGGVMHSYILPGCAWEAPAQRGTVVDSIPFTHPAHVPALLELLRHQSVINILLRSGLTYQPDRASCDLHYEVLPESETSFSVTFHRPDSDSLAVLLVNVSDSHQISCTLFGAGTGTGDPSVNEYLSTVMMRSMSVPGTLMALHSELTSLAPSPHRLGPTEAESDRLGPSSTAVSDPSGAFTMFPRGVSWPEEGSSGPGPACFAMSVTTELHPIINMSPAVNFYPFSPMGVFPYWMINYSQLSEPM